MTDDSDTAQSSDASEDGGADHQTEPDVPDDPDEWEWAGGESEEAESTSESSESVGDPEETDSAESNDTADTTSESDDQPGGESERVAELEEKVEEQAEQIEAYKRELAKAKKEIDRLRDQKEEVADRVRKQTEDDVVEDFFEVRDNLVRALDQGEDANIRGGVEATLMQFDDLLRSLGIEVIDPPSGAEVEPDRHEVIDRVDGEHEEGLIEEVFRHGYARSDRVIRAAQVGVSDGTKQEDDNEE